MAVAPAVALWPKEALAAPLLFAKFYLAARRYVNELSNMVSMANQVTTEADRRCALCPLASVDLDCAFSMAEISAPPPCLFPPLINLIVSKKIKKKVGVSWG